MLERLTQAMVIAGWASCIWAPVIIGMTVRRPGYKWPAVAGVATAMLALFGGIYALSQPALDCESLEEFEKILCWEGNAGKAVIMGMTMITMIPAVLLVSAILYICRDVSKPEPRKAAH